MNEEIEKLIVRLLAESYIDLEAPDGRPRFLVDGSIYSVTKEETALIDAWLTELFKESGVGA